MAAPEEINADMLAFWNGKGGHTWVARQEHTDITLTPVTDALLGFAAPRAGERVVDIGCGCGAPTLEFARAVGPSGRALGVQIAVLNASTEPDLDEAFASLGKPDAGGLVVPAEPFFDSQRERIVSLAAQHAMPMMSNLREYVVAGGLMSYGGSLPDSYRRAGIYVGRVLNGEKPADLPVMQPTKFDLVINVKTAKALGLTCACICSSSLTR